MNADRMIEIRYMAKEIREQLSEEEFEEFRFAIAGIHPDRYVAGLAEENYVLKARLAKIQEVSK